MSKKWIITVTTEELDTILAALGFYAEDYERAAEKDPWRTPEEQVEYREKAKRAEKAATRIVEQTEGGC